ncbi:MAG: beta-ketoacyl-ACP synthase III FabHB [Candidatus Elarobacter sp.]
MDAEGPQVQQTVPQPTSLARSVRSSLRIEAMGTFVPEKRLTNDDLSQMVETDNAWIVRRTGIFERRISGELEFSTDLCVGAVRDMESRGATLDGVDYIIGCTVTPDYGFPSMAAQLQHRLGLRNCGAVDVAAACAGFVYGLDLADALLTSGRARRVLVAAGETLSKVIDYTDRATCILFGDGAGVAIVSADPGAPDTLLARRAGCDGASGKELYVTGLRNEMAGLVESEPVLRQNGRAVYEWAVGNVTAGIAQMLENAGLTPADVDWFIPHSANARMIDLICKRSGIARERTLTSLEYYGNTSSASIPLALAPAINDGRVRAGDIVLLYGFGGGLVENGMLLRWS